MKVTMLVLIICLFCSPLYAWTEYKNIRSMDMDGDLTPEVIIESGHGAGMGHYMEDMRIFKDNYPNLELIFTTRTLDRYFGFDDPIHNCDIISMVEFTEQTVENNGIRDIIVKTKKVYYKDEERKIVGKEENLGTEIYKWNGEIFVLSSGQKER